MNKEEAQVYERTACYVQHLYYEFHGEDKEQHVKKLEPFISYKDGRANYNQDTYQPAVIRTDYPTIDRRAKKAANKIWDGYLLARAVPTQHNRTMFNGKAQEKTLVQEYIPKPEDIAKAPVIKSEQKAEKRVNRIQTKALTREQEAAKELAQRELSKRHLLPFVMRFTPGYQPGWAHKIICAELERFEQDILDKKSPRLMIACPPRFGKSQISSVCYPAWFLGRNPSFEIIASSYATSLSLTFSRKARGILGSKEFGTIFPGITLDQDNKSAESWMTNRSGAYVASGVGSGITGKGAHCLSSITPIYTKRGVIAIKDCKEGDYALSYKSNKLVWSPINAIIKRTVSSTYKVTTTKGGFRATGEHPICVCASREDRIQYRRVDDLQIGDTLDSFDFNKDSLKMPSLQKSLHESNEQIYGRKYTGLFSQMLSKVTKSWRSFTLTVRTVQKNIRQASVGTKTEAEAGGQTRFLFSKMLSSIPHKVWGRPPQVQLCGIGMYSMQAEVQAPKIQYFKSEDKKPFLLNGVLQQMVSWSPYPEGYRTEFGEVLPRRVQVHEKDVDERCELQYLREICDRPSPQRREQGEQQFEQLTSSLQIVPCKVTSITKVNETIEVYDIEVEGTNNFLLQNNLLSHNCAILDDCIKDRVEADSETTRESVKDWYSSTLYTRLSPGGGIVTIATRWHEDDLLGWLETRMADKDDPGADNWRIIKFPAIATEDEKYRQKGEALHPERYDLKQLTQIKNNMLPRDWGALFQQNPVADEGAYFRREFFRYYTPDSLPAINTMNIYSAFDLAISKKTSADYTVGVTVGVDEHDRLYLLNLTRGRFDALQIVDLILTTYEEWKPTLIGIERGQIELSIQPILEKRMRERGLYPAIEKLLPGRADKEARARSIQGRMQQGMVYFPKEAGWLEVFEHELLMFPAGRTDDMTDALAWIGLMLSSIVAPRKVKGTPNKSWRDRLSKFSMGKRYKSAMSA